MRAPAHVRLRRARASGFTLVEVMIALLLAMIGLMGTVAIQQTVLTATKNSNDAQIAMRLATQTVETLNARSTLTQPTDLLGPIATGAWTAPVFLDEQGGTSAIATPRNRFQSRFMVTNTGPSTPYNITVEVRYSLESGTPKLVRLDVERRKSW